MKKLALALTLAAALTAAAHAQEPEGWGVGIFGMGGDITAVRSVWDMGITIRPETLPVYFGVLFSGLNYSGGGNDVFNFGMGVTADFHFLRTNIGEFRGDAYLDLFVGLGGFFGFSLVENGHTSLTFGGRLPVGLSFVVPVSQNAVEVFAAVVPTFGFGIIRSSGGVMGGAGSEVGVRIWL